MMLQLFYCSIGWNLGGPSSEISNINPSGAITIHQTNLETWTIAPSLALTNLQTHHTNTAYDQMK